MIHQDTQNLDREGITVLFDTDHPEQVQAIHHFRRAFGPASDLEALDERYMLLTLRPGCGCGSEGEAA